MEDRNVDPFLLHANLELPPEQVGTYGAVAMMHNGNAASALGEPAASAGNSGPAAGGAAQEQFGALDAMTTLGLRLGAGSVKTKLRSPIFLENPDGTITEANPTRTENRKLRSAAEGRTSGNEDGSDVGSSASETPASVLHREVDVIYWRHERMMMLLLGAQLLLEVLFNYVYVSRMWSSVDEFMSLYAWHQSYATKVAVVLFQFVFAFQIFYSITFYFLATIALMTRKPYHYRVFVFWSAVGIVLQALLAYIDKFNLLIFSLRILSFIYGRLLQSLSTSLQLLPRA